MKVAVILLALTELELLRPQQPEGWPLAALGEQVGAAAAAGQAAFS